MPRPAWGLLTFVMLFGPLGCAGASAARASPESAAAFASSATAPESSDLAMAGDAVAYHFAEAPEPTAQLATPALAEGVTPSDRVASDATPRGPVIVYSASFTLSVYEVEKAQVALKAAAQKLGGFVALQTDTQLTLRVPAQRFEAALVAIETTGKVQGRNVEALDVGEQYRDLSIRLRTAEAMRTRLEAMLARAEKVEQALLVEKELERVVSQIEQLKGQLRALGDRIAFSTLTIEFRPEVRPDIDDGDVFRLPYAWLDELGLPQLLELTP